MKRTIIVGDVHGCLEELQELIQQLAPNANDHVIFIGDLIDRGPDSIGVVHQVEQLSALFKVSLILGNHEDKFLRYVHHMDTKSGKEKDMKGILEFPSLLNNLNPSALEFLKKAFHSIHLPEFNSLIIHGGVGKDVKFPFPASYPFSIPQIDEFKNINLLNKTRYLTPEGKFVSLGEEKSEDRFWAETYNGQWGHIYFGHQPFIQDSPYHFPHATALDTGCVFGGWLTAAVLSDRGVTYHSIKASKVYSIKK